MTNISFISSNLLAINNTVISRSAEIVNLLMGSASLKLLRKLQLRNPNFNSSGKGFTSAIIVSVSSESVNTISPDTEEPFLIPTMLDSTQPNPSITNFKVLLICFFSSMLNIMLTIYQCLVKLAFINSTIKFR